MKELGRVELKPFVEWCESKEHMLEESIYSQDYNRLVIPLGYKLVNVKPPKVIKAHYDERMDKLASRFCPDWKLSLLCKYGKGGGVRLHRDASIYGRQAFVLSSTDYLFIIDGLEYSCKGGIIYQFDSKKLHSVPPLEEQRWALIWWEPSKLWNEQFQQLSLL
ncbi:MULTISPECIES: hypothetical protein [unclassified Moorena]|uniref:hypothetical protein n=1 Tax=unclassified Moorena TaxID=2683338 RepID=UPI0013C91BEF|nr:MULTISPECIES: hypothetical protein [unclassified Moorena]NEO22127.1 hypothetical protein [Moorena sp. SIO4A5]NEO43369.1 hypothetical protein [Moorena sp. SIO4A3]NEP24320.1 hypothetical protein [Moorena sp. SIO3I6]